MIKDWILVRLVDVFTAQKVNEVARIHAVESVEEHVEAILEMNQLTFFHVHRVESPLSEMIEDLKEVG